VELSRRQEFSAGRAGPTRARSRGVRRAALWALLLTGLGLAPFNPLALVASPLTPPGAAHPLGTDHLGRDVLSRLLHGGRWTLSAGLLAALIAAGPGTLLGLLAGYFEGPTDALITLRAPR